MHQLLTEMSPERLATIYGNLSAEIIRALDVPIAKALNSRPGSIARRPESLKVKGLRAFLKRTRDDAVAGDILRAYLLGPRAELVTTFLDETGVEHEDGQIEGDGEPASDKVAGAVAKLNESFDPDDVQLYLRVALLQWPDNKGLAQVLEGLQPQA